MPHYIPTYKGYRAAQRPRDPDLTPLEYYILKEIYEDPTATTSTLTNKPSNVTPTEVNQTIKSLERKGYTVKTEMES